MKVTAELAPQDTLLANITSPFAVVTRDHVGAKAGTVLIRLMDQWCLATDLTETLTSHPNGRWAGQIYALPAKSITLTA